jgi:hypothetical protein
MPESKTFSKGSNSRSYSDHWETIRIGRGEIWINAKGKAGLVTISALSNNPPGIRSIFLG